MKQFLHRWSSEIKGTLSGFDRVRFRGAIRWLASLAGMGSYLGTARGLLKEFKDWATDKTDRIQKATEKLAESAGRPVVYLPSSSERKEARALEIARADGILVGRIGSLPKELPAPMLEGTKTKSYPLTDLRLPFDIEPFAAWKERLSIVHGLRAGAVHPDHGAGFGALAAVTVGVGDDKRRNIPAETIDAAIARKLGGIFPLLNLGVDPGQPNTKAIRCSSAWGPGQPDDQRVVQHTFARHRRPARPFQPDRRGPKESVACRPADGCLPPITRTVRMTGCA